MTDQIDEGYAVQLLEFAPDPWPEQSVVEHLAEQVVAGSTWDAAIARFKAKHHLEDGKWVANA